MCLRQSKHEPYGHIRADIGFTHRIRSKLNASSVSHIREKQLSNLTNEARNCRNCIRIPLINTLRGYGMYQSRPQTAEYRLILDGGRDNEGDERAGGASVMILKTGNYFHEPNGSHWNRSGYVAFYIWWFYILHFEWIRLDLQIIISTLLSTFWTDTNKAIEKYVYFLSIYTKI